MCDIILIKKKSKTKFPNIQKTIKVFISDLDSLRFKSSVIIQLFKMPNWGVTFYLLASFTWQELVLDAEYKTDTNLLLIKGMSH